jgi:hypothetical protein
MNAAVRHGQCNGLAPADNERGILHLRLGRDRLACHLVRDTAAARISTPEDKDEDWHRRRRERWYRPR